MLHEAYAPLATQGLRFLATHQDSETTRRRLSGGETIVALDADTIVGIVTLKDAEHTKGSPFYDRADVAGFGQFAVRPSHQRMGIGSTLLTIVERRADEKGVKVLALDTSEHAAHLVRFYESKGYSFVEYLRWRDVNYRSMLFAKALTTDHRPTTTPTIDPGPMTMDHRPYRHTQIGWQVYGVAIPLTSLVIYSIADAQTAGLVLVIVAAAFVLFGWLTVGIDTRRVLIKFGIGLITRSIPLDTIRGFAPLRNPWYYGWGVRFTPHGILYNVSGFQAVEILLDDGRRVRVGTDEPDVLVRALQAATTVAPSKTIDEFPKDVAWRRRIRLIAAVIVALTAAFILGQVYVHSQPPTVEIAGGTLSTGSGFYSVDIPLSDIQSVELADTLPRIQRRTNGFAAGGLLRGNFRLDEWGSGRLFINRNSPPFVVVRTRESFVVVNFADPVATRDLYGRLSGLVRP